MATQRKYSRGTKLKVPRGIMQVKSQASTSMDGSDASGRRTRFKSVSAIMKETEEGLKTRREMLLCRSFCLCLRYIDKHY